MAKKLVGTITGFKVVHDHEAPPPIKRRRGRPVVRTDEVLEMIRLRVVELVAEGRTERQAIKQIARDGGYFHQVGRADMKPGPDGKRKPHRTVWDDPERLWQEYMEAKRRHRYLLYQTRR